MDATYGSITITSGDPGDPLIPVAMDWDGTVKPVGDIVYAPFGFDDDVRPDAIVTAPNAG